MVIDRDFYLNKLVEHKNNGMVKVVTGVRRCGKSYLLNVLFYGHLKSCGIPDSHIIKIALDDYGNKDLLNPDNLYSYVKSRIVDPDNYYILLDEIQLVENFEGVVNGFLHIDNADVYVTGSNSKFLSSDVITEFRGRGDEIRVYPLCFSEFYATAEPGEPFGDAWLRYVTYGGMPLCLTMKSEEDKVRYLKGLFETTYLADIVNRRGLRGNSEIGELTDVLASSVGSLTNPLKLSDTFNSKKHVKLSVNTVSTYLDYLQDAFLIDKAVRFDIKGKRYINTPSKYYFVDVGLRNARLAFRQRDFGAMTENVIYNELKLRGYSVDVGVVEANVKENGTTRKKQYEVDFVVNFCDRRYYIQSAYTMPNEEKIKQEQASLLGIDDAFKKIIIVNDAVVTGYNERGILIATLADFLMSPEKVFGR